MDIQILWLRLKSQIGHRSSELRQLETPLHRYTNLSTQTTPFHQIKPSQKTAANSYPTAGQNMPFVRLSNRAAGESCLKCSVLCRTPLFRPVSEDRRVPSSLSSTLVEIINHYLELLDPAFSSHSNTYLDSTRHFLLKQLRLHLFNAPLHPSLYSAKKKRYHICVWDRKFEAILEQKYR